VHRHGGPSVEPTQDRPRRNHEHWQEQPGDNESRANPKRRDQYGRDDGTESDRQEQNALENAEDTRQDSLRREPL
jgi:hypothetical protein